MKTKKIKLFVTTLLVLALLIPSSTLTFASSLNNHQEEILSPRTVDLAVISFKKVSSTKATAKVTAASSGQASSITSKITLQEAPPSSSNYKDSSVPSQSKTVNDIKIIHNCDFPISAGKDYRIKVELTDIVNGVKITAIYYKNLS